MKVINLINELEDLIESSSPKSIFLGGGVNINKRDLIDMLHSIRNELPEEVKAAHWIKEERTKILDGAEHDAREKIEKAKIEIDEMLAEKKLEAERLISNHEITLKSIEYSKSIVDKANLLSEEIKKGARAYVERVMNELHTDIENYAESIVSNRTELKSFIDKSIESESGSAQEYKERISSILDSREKDSN